MSNRSTLWLVGAAMLVVAIWVALGTGDTRTQADAEWYAALDDVPTQSSGERSPFEVIGSASPDDDPGEVGVETWLDIESRYLGYIRDESKGRVTIESLGRDLLESMSRLEVDAYFDRLLEELRSVRERNRELAQPLIDAYQLDWTSRSCPSGDTIDEAMFAESDLPVGSDVPRLVDAGDLEVLHAVDLVLNDATLFVDDWNWLGERGTETRFARPGSYPLFVVRTTGSERQEPALAQLVVRPGSQIVRWVKDERFYLSAEYSLVWFGSPAARLVAHLDTSDPVEATAYEYLFDTLSGSYPDLCAVQKRSDGVNLAQVNTGWDGVYDGYAGYNASGDLVAISWDFRALSSPQQAFPGIGPALPGDIDRSRSGAGTTSPSNGEDVKALTS